MAGVTFPGLLPASLCSGPRWHWEEDVLSALTAQCDLSVIKLRQCKRRSSRVRPEVQSHLGTALGRYLRGRRAFTLKSASCGIVLTLPHLTSVC